PPGCELRPVFTGWFSVGLDQAHARGGRVEYGDGAARFAGATYDPTPHYRAAAVFDFHVEQELTAVRLREISRHQVGVLQREFEALDVDSAVAHVEPMADERRAGFLAIRSPIAASLPSALRDRGVFADARGDVLRLGPAPYITDHQLRDGMVALGEV